MKKAKDYRLVYVFSESPISPAAEYLRLADTKMIFEKILKADSPTDPQIKTYTGTLTDRLLSLALESGTFSRFRTDPHFQSGEFEKLYQAWIRKALGKDLVMIVEDFAGFITCEVGDSSAQIGLIAVDPNHRGKGLATKLLQAAEFDAFQNGLNSIIVSTQEANIPACGLFQTQGFILKDRIYIYHYWNEDRQ